MFSTIKPQLVPDWHIDVPSSNLNVGSTSGTVTAFLPAAPGFTCRVETASGSFSSALPLAGDRNTYTCGDGTARCVLHTTSGDIRVEEYR